MGAPSAPHRRAATSSVTGQVAGARRTLYGYSLRRLSRSMAIGHVACAFFSLASCGAGWRRPLLHALRRCRLRRGGECRRRSAVTSLVNSGVSLCMGGETYWTAGRLSGAAGTRCGARRGRRTRRFVSIVLFVCRASVTRRYLRYNRIVIGGARRSVGRLL